MAVATPPQTNIQPAMKARRLTYADYRALPDDGTRYELVEGELRIMPSPTTSHQTVVLNLAVKLKTFTKEKDLGLVFVAPLDVQLSDDLCYQPDVLFVAKESKAQITEVDIQGAPDLVVEIVSPSSRRIDRKEKMGNYAKHGAREYWLVYPETIFVEVFVLRDGKYEMLGRYGEGEMMRSEVLSGLEFLTETMFE